MYLLVHLIMIFFGFIVGAIAWASFFASDASWKPYWCIGGLIGLTVGWAIAGTLMRGSSKTSDARKTGRAVGKAGLTACPDCGQMVSRRAASCPQYGCPLTNEQLQRE